MTNVAEQSERPQFRAEPVAGHCRTVTESPDLWVLGGVRWQFFGPFTFKQERLPERIRQPLNNHKSVKSED